MGNIPDEHGADPWPKYGLVAKYKPFILKRIKPFLENNRRLDRNDVISNAIRITWEASREFKSELGYEFSTYLRHWLPNRLYDAFGITKEPEDADILKTEPVRFLGGGNGARLVLDTGTLIVGAQMADNDLGYLTGMLDRLRSVMEPARSDFLAFDNAEPFLRALVDHAERREREAIAEAEQGGGVVLLEARDLQADVRLFKDNRLVKFKPALVINDRKNKNNVFEHIGSHQIVNVPVGGRGYQLRGRFGNFKGSGLYDKPPVPEHAFDSDAEELDEIAKSANLTDVEQKVLAFMRGPLGRTDTEMAKLVGVSQGHYFKLKGKVVAKMREAGNGRFWTDDPGHHTSDFFSNWISAPGGDE